MQQDNKLLYYITKWSNITKEDEATIISAFEPVSIQKKKDLLVSGQVCDYLFYYQRLSSFLLY